MQGLLARGAKAEEDRAAGGEVTTSDGGTPFSGTTATAFSEFVPESLTDAATEIEVMGTGGPGAGSAGGSSRGGGGFGGFGGGKTAAAAAAAAGAVASSVSSSDLRPASVLSSPSASRAIETRGLLARDEHRDENGARSPSPTTGPGSRATSSTMISSERNPGASGSGTGVIVNGGEAPHSPLRRAKQVRAAAVRMCGVGGVGGGKGKREKKMS